MMSAPEQDASAAMARHIAPGPKGRPILGNLLDFRKDRLSLFLQAKNKYGDIVRFSAGRRTLFLISSPAMIKYVLQDNNKNYALVRRRKEKFKLLLGNGLITSEGELWRQQRRLVQPAFHQQKIRNFTTTMVNLTIHMLRRWQQFEENNRPFDVAVEMEELTLAIVTQTLFGSTLTPQETQTITAIMPSVLYRTNRRIDSFTGFLKNLPTHANRQYKRDLHELETILNRLIEERRRIDEKPSDLLGLLVTAFETESAGGMDRKQLRDEVMTLFLSGHETTANHLAWTWYLLSQHPGVRQRLQEEIDVVLQGNLPTLESLEYLPYTRMVIDESLRLYPPAWAFSRCAIRDDEIGGYHIPSGAHIIISSYVVHRHPEYWQNPERFDPERFRRAQKHKQSQDNEWPKYAYFPFGGGPRLCIGNNFALMEATLVLAVVAQQYELHLMPSHPVQPEGAITLRPKNGIMVTLRSRMRGNKRSTL
jgi:cytochrome P450